MKIHEYDQMMKHLTRPASKYSKTEKDKIIKDHYKDSAEYFEKQNPKANKKPMNVLKYIDTVNKNYGNSDIKIKSDAEYERLNPTKKAPAEPTIEHTKIGMVKNFDKPKYKYVGTREAPINKKPYWVNRNGKLLDANNAEHWQSTKKVAEKAKPTEFKEYKFEIPDFYFEEEEEQKRQDALRKHNFNKILLSSALSKIDDALSGINGVAVRRKLNEGGPTDDNNNKPILLSDYLKLGLTLANLTDSEREIVKDLLDKSFPKYK